MATGKTVPKQLTPFKPGQSGNPKGRPKGSKSKLTESFWSDFALAWEAHGAAALKKVAANEPGTFVRVAATLMPKETEVTLRRVTAKELPDDELASIAIGSGEGADTPPVDPAQLN
jgi:hypothetical protein